MKHIGYWAAQVGPLVAVCLALSLSRSAAGDKKDAKEEAKLLQGRWTVWRIENSNGLVADCSDAILVEGNEILNLNGGSTKGTQFKFTIDPSKDPMEITVEILARGNIGEKRLGIYRLSNNVLEICWGDAKKRPTKFAGRLAVAAGSEYLIYRGEKFKPDEAVTKEMKRFEGKWLADDGGNGGLFEDDHIQFLTPAGKGPRARFLVDPSQNPKEIEIIYTSGSEIYKRRIGIYQLEGDKLTLSMSDHDSNKRPMKLKGGDAPGAGKWFAVYKRRG
jgi:uncharacterized protein (TIGR03067 family)